MISDVHRHQPLSVERRPTDEECNHDRNCITYKTYVLLAYMSLISLSR